MMAKKTIRKKKLTLGNIKRPEDTGETIGDIERRMARRKPEAPRAAAGKVVNVSRAHIKVAEKAFQWRSDDRNKIPEERNILTLAKALREEGRLDAILLYQTPGADYVLDGHHRLAAYDTCGWKKDIPAQFFHGTLREAEREALKRNSRHGRQLSARDRTNAAWRLVTQAQPGEWPDSVRETAAMCGVGHTTVDRMRAVWRTLHQQEDANIDELKTLSWTQAQRKANGEPEYKEQDDWLNAEAEKLVDAIKNKKLGNMLTKSADVTALALAMLDEGLPAELMAYWKEDPPFDPHEGGDDLNF